MGKGTAYILQSVGQLRGDMVPEIEARRGLQKGTRLLKRLGVRAEGLRAEGSNIIVKDAMGHTKFAHVDQWRSSAMPRA